MRWNKPSGYSGGIGFGQRSLSPFIKLMLLANLAVFLLEKLIPDITPIFAFTPALVFQQFPLHLYQVITYMFLHANFWHLFFNMFALWMFGTEIEFAWGTRAFARFYFIAGICGALLTWAVYIVTGGSPMLGASGGPIVGASGAIYGVLIAYWLMFPDRLLYLYLILPIPVKFAIPALMLLGFFTGGPNTAHMAHVGGAAFGLAYLKLDWRWNWLGRRWKNLRYKRQEAKLNKRRQEADDIMRKVDAILDKINEVGMENLTKAERKFLEEASSILQKQKEHRER